LYHAGVFNLPPLIYVRWHDHLLQLLLDWLSASYCCDAPCSGELPDCLIFQPWPPLGLPCAGGDGH
jgi:hypothetical protein